MLLVLALALVMTSPARADGAAGEARPIPLIDAVRTGNMARVRDLIHDNADVNVARLNGFTALHMAARTGNEAMARLLIQAGADVNAATMGNKVTPLYIAAAGGYPAVARLLLSKGARINQPTVAIAVVNGRLRILDLLFRHGADIDRRDPGGETYLHLAVLGGRVDIVNLLLRYGAKVDARDRNGLTPLSLAAGDEAVTAALRGNGAKDTPAPDWKTLITTGDMASARDDYKTAGAKYELALADLGRQPAHESLPWRLMVLQKLARAYMQTGRLDKAKRAGERFIKGYREGAGVGRLALARVSTLMGRIDVEQGDLARAEEHYRTAADIYEGQSPPDTASLTDAYLRLANTLIRQRRYHRAQTVFEKARRVLEQDKHADPVILAMTEQNLAHALRFQGKLDEAEALYEHSNALLAKAPGADSGMTADGIYGLADIARRKGQLDKASALYEKAIDAFEKSNTLSPSALKTVKREYQRLRRRLSRPARGN